LTSGWKEYENHGTSPRSSRTPPGSNREALPCSSLPYDQSILIKRNYFHGAFWRFLSLSIDGKGVIIFKLPCSPALLKAIGRTDPRFNKAAVELQCHGGSAAGGGKRKKSGSENPFRRGIFLVRMHPLLVQSAPVDVLLHGQRVSVRVTACRSSCADRSGPHASAPPAAR